MRFFHLRLSFLVFAWLALLAGALHARDLPPSASWPQDTADIHPDPNVVWGRLSNGMRYVLLPNSTPKDRISMRLLIEAGSLMEREDQRGLAHLLEHMAFKGSENMPAGDLVQYLERLGMAFGADTNARTSFDSTVYQLELPSNDPQIVDRSLFVMREKVDRLLMPAAELERERRVVLSEKRLRDTPQFRSFDADFAFLFPDSLVAQRMPIGVTEVISNAPRDRLLDFYRTWYTPSHTILVVVGAFDPKALAPLIAKHFESFNAKRPEAPDPDLGRITPRKLETHLHYEAEGRTNVTLQSVKPTDPRPDIHAKRVEEINLYLAHAIISRRLATLALVPNAPFVGGFAQSDDFANFARISSLTVNTPADQWREGLAVAEQSLRQALTFGFTPAELDEQVRKLLTEFEENARSAATRQSPEIADEIVHSLTERRVFTHPEQDLAELRRILADVTPQTVLDALRGVWSQGGPLIFVSGPVKLDDPDAAIAEAYRASLAQAVVPPTQNAVQQFAYDQFGGKPAIVERKVSDVLDVTQLRFANNVRVNLKPTKFEANTVLVSVRFGGGRLELPPELPGLEQLAESAFVAGGLEKHSLDDLNRITVGHTIGLGFEVEDDAFVMGGRTTPSDLQLQLQLLAAYITAPGYRPEGLAKFRQALPQLYQTLERTPNGIVQKDVVRFLRAGDPRFGYPEQAVLAKRTLEELRALLKEPLAHGYLELSIVGDFDIDQAIAAVSATFGSLPARAAVKPDYREARAVHFPHTQGLTTFAYDSSDPKALAAAYWPTTDFSQVSEVRRLYVLSKVLGNRVLERARNVEGLTYTAQGEHAPSQAFPGYGILYAAVDAAPDRARGLAEEIITIAGEIYDKGVTEDELERARNPVVSELKRLLNTNGYLLSAIVSGSQERPEKLARATTSVQELSSLTVEDLNRVARKYLDPRHGVPVIIVPHATMTAQPQNQKGSTPRAAAIVPEKEAPKPQPQPVEN